MEAHRTRKNSVSRTCDARAACGHAALAQLRAVHRAALRVGHPLEAAALRVIQRRCLCEHDPGVRDSGRPLHEYSLAVRRTSCSVGPSASCLPEGTNADSMTSSCTVGPKSGYPNDRAGTAHSAMRSSLGRRDDHQQCNARACVFSDAKRVATMVAPSETTKLSSESSVTPAAACSAVMLAMVACDGH